MLSWFFLLDDLVVGLGIIATVVSIAILLAWPFVWSRWRKPLRACFIQDHDLTMLLSLLFSLTIGFLSAEIETRNESAASTVGMEANAFQTLAYMLSTSPRAAEALRPPATRYLNAVLKHEFSGDRQLIETSSGSARMSELFADVMAYSQAHDANDVASRTIVELVIRASEARGRRLALMQSGVNELKWYLVGFLLLALQLSLVLVTADSPRKMLIVLFLVSLAGGSTVAAAALQEDPFTPPRMVSSAPLELALKGLSSPPASN